MLKSRCHSVAAIGLCAGRLTATLLACLGFIAMAPLANGAPPLPIENPPAVDLPASATNAGTGLQYAAPTDDGLFQVMVELQDPSAAVVFAQAMQGTVPTDRGALAAAGAASRAQVARVRAAQDQFAVALAASSIRSRELYRVAKAMNGIALAVAESDFANLAALPGVKRVLPILLEQLHSATSVPFIGAPKVWANTIGLPAGADGTGVRIGIIDTGIDYMHADFGGTGLLADYQAESTDTAGFTTVGTATAGPFPTAKVVGGVDFAGDAYNGGNAPVPDANPMDCNGHGSHVAGTAAGFGVTAAGATFTGPYDANNSTYSPLRIIPGAAPKALLYGIRVFGCGGGTGLTVQGIDWAMDPNGDSDLSDHLDVINMSLGSNYGSVPNASSVASENAALAGVIVAISAGNSGDSYFIVGSPGVASRAITTAASVDSGESFESVKVNAPAAIAGSYFGGSAAFGPAPSGQTANVVLAGDAGNLACVALPNAAAMVGNICIANRGTCSFKTKALTCQNAGGIGLIVVNNAPGSPPPGMADDPTIVTPITIPTEMVTLADGNTLKANIATLNATLLGQAAGDTLASFSSRGPRSTFGSPLRVKPDIAAPGLNITSVQTGHTCTSSLTGCTGLIDPTGYQAGNQALVISGTSMASPHIAGVMALLRQLHPDWSVEELKALVMNYAIHDVTEFANATPPRYAASRIGAGRVDPATAAIGSVIAMNADDVGLVSVTFDPEVVGPGPVTRTKKIRLVNKGLTPQTFDLGFDNVVDSPGVVFSLPGGSSVTVPAADAVELTIQMTATPSLMDHTRDPSLFPTQGVQVNYGDQPRNFLTEESSYLTFSQSAALKFRVPVYMAEKPSSDMSAPPTIVTSGAPTGSTTIALSGTGLCTGTLAAGPTCTGVGTLPKIESLVSPFELQVVSPLDPVNAVDYADIHYVGTSFLPGAGSPSLTNDLIMFGVASWGDWSTPNDVAYNICIDNNNDGKYEKILYNSNPSIFVSGASPNDNYVRIVRDTTSQGNSILGLGSLVNLVSPASYDTALQLNNVMILGASPSQLGFVSTAVTTLRYKVITCPGSNPACARTDPTVTDGCSPAPGTYYDIATGPYVYNWAAQGLNFGGSFLAEDLNGSSLPVAWNTANMTANASQGALLLHHHNGAGKRAEVVLLDSAQTADLALTNSVNNATPAAGGTVIFTLTVTNNGPNNATGVVVSDPLPVGLAYVSDDGGGAYGSGTGLWTVGALANAASATLHITATAQGTSQIDNVAQITAATPLDTNPSNDRATASLRAPRTADLALTFSANVASVNPGGSIIYTLTVKNLGGDPAYGVNVHEAFPLFPALAPSSFTASQGLYTPATGIWNLSGLPVGSSATLTFTVTAPNYAGALANNASTATNAAVVPGDAVDPNIFNNSAVATVQVVSPATITATKTVSGSFVEGGAVTYTVVLSNSSAFAQQDNAGNEFTDVLPAQLTLVSASASAGTTVATVATNTVTWNGVVPGNGSVTITINATIKSGTAAQLVSNQGTASFDADGNGSNESTALTDDPAVAGSTDPTRFTVIAPPAILKAFGAATIPLNGSTGVTYTISSPAGNVPLTGVAFTDTLPAGLVVATPNGLGGTCNGARTATAGSGSVTLSAATLAAGASSCTVTLNVTGTTAGVKNSGASVTATQSGAGNISTASVTVVKPAAISKAFGAASIAVGASTSLSFTISNTANSGVTLTGIGFTDPLPAGLVIATPNGLSGSCGGGTITATQATTSVTLAGASLADNATCTFSINVTLATGGAQNNVTGAVSSTEGGAGNTATASLNGFAPPTIAKAFGAATVALNGTTSLTITVGNPAANPAAATGLAFSDPLPAGLVVATPNALANTCGGTATATAGSGTVSLSGATLAAGSTCTVSVNVTGTTAGAKVNTTGAVTSTNGGTGTTATATLTVGAPPAIAKAFGAATMAINGSTSLTFTITNPSTIAVTGVAFTDTLPAGLVVSTPNALANTCGGTASAVAGSGSVSLAAGTIAASGSCTLSVNVTGTTVGAKVNTTGAVSATETGTGTVSNTATVSVVQTTVSGPTATGTGTATATFTTVAGGPNCTFTFASFVPITVVPTGAPAGITFPQGLFDFTVANCTPGFSMVLTVTYPQALPQFAQYYKYGPTAGNTADHWYVMPASVSGNTATLTIVDGGLGDDDLTVNGSISDQGGPGVPSAPAIVPTLQQGLTVLLALLALLAGIVVLRRRRAD